MSLTPQQVEVLQSSFRVLQPLGATAAALFYRRLFEPDPSVAPLFKGDMQEQGRKFMQVLAVAAGGMSSLSTLAPVIRQLGARHAIYGVRPEHYESVREALLWSVARVLQDAYTEEVRTTWLVAYSTLAAVMKEAAWGTAWPRSVGRFHPCTCCSLPAGGDPSGFEDLSKQAGRSPLARPRRLEPALVVDLGHVERRQPDDGRLARRATGPALEPRGRDQACPRRNDQGRWVCRRRAARLRARSAAPRCQRGMAGGMRGAGPRCMPLSSNSISPVTVRAPSANQTTASATSSALQARPSGTPAS